MSTPDKHQNIIYDPKEFDDYIESKRNIRNSDDFVTYSDRPVVLKPTFLGAEDGELPFIIRIYDPEAWLAEGRYDLIKSYIDYNEGNQYCENRWLRSAIAKKLAELKLAEAILQELLDRLEGPKWQGVGGLITEQALDDSTTEQ